MKHDSHNWKRTQPTPQYRQAVIRFACKAKDLTKTIRFMAAGIGAVWKFDISDTEIYVTDRYCRDCTGALAVCKTIYTDISRN